MWYANIRTKSNVNNVVCFLVKSQGRIGVSVGVDTHARLANSAILRARVHLWILCMSWCSTGFYVGIGVSVAVFAVFNIYLLQVQAPRRTTCSSTV